ncbi:MAG: fumarate reductase/succinate dehydrogenase flavoprotein subunit [Gemmatimonadaceae bacterium]|nr:fumarate reductase/succinate dehydrogenase flavoprotein subunit [Gemmatimonadaceae bacterium]
MALDPRVPDGPLEKKWDKCRNEMKLVGPINKRKHRILVIGTGLAGASAAASLAELGYQVDVFCIQDSARRAHSVAAQGGINAAKNYRADGDSAYRFFYDTLKGGDFRSREANTYRLAEISGNVIDQCVAQGVPFAREYGGQLDGRSFGGVLVSRTFYARGQTGQQLLLGAYSALSRQVGLGAIRMHTRTEMQDLVVVDGRARGVITRHLETGELKRWSGDAVVLATGGYANVYYLSTNGRGGNVTATYRAYKRGAFFANPCYVQFHPTCIPAAGEHQSKLTLMSESLRNDGRVWVPKKKGDTRAPGQIPEDERDYYLERLYPSFGNLSPRDIASRAAKRMCDEGYGVGPGRQGVYLDLADSIKRLGEKVIRERYGNLFEMYEKITGDDPTRVPMRIYPAAHFTMGGLWVDYHLMSNLPGLFVLGEANFSDHGANRLGANALLQGLVDGYFIAPQTISHYVADSKPAPLSADHAAFAAAEQEARDRIGKLIAVNGSKSADVLHRELGQVMWHHCGISRNRGDLEKGLGKIAELRERFWREVRVPGVNEEYNMALERALRVADFMEFADVIVRDAIDREESCGAHLREEYQTPEGEAKRDDEKFCNVAAFEHKGVGVEPVRHIEPLTFETLHLSTRSYK